MAFDRLHTRFLFVFHCNYGHTLYRFHYKKYDDKARHWSKNANFSYPLPFNLHDHPHPEPLEFRSKILTQTVRVPKVSPL